MTRLTVHTVGVRTVQTTGAQLIAQARPGDRVTIRVPASIPQQYFAARQHRAAAQMRRPVVGQPAQVLLDGGYCLDSLV